MKQLAPLTGFLILLFAIIAWHNCQASETILAGKRYDARTKSCRSLGFESLWYGKGRRLFDQKCKTCHSRGSSQKAPFLYTESLPPKGWNRVFYKRRPMCAKNGSWKTKFQEELLINDYLYVYGANTYDANHEL